MGGEKISALLFSISSQADHVRLPTIVHLDADALDDAIMPAVDYRIEGGLSWEELRTTLRAALQTNRCVGLDVTIFNPRLDKDGAITQAFVDTLVEALRN